MDTELDRIHMHFDTPPVSKPSSSKKKMMGSLERGMDKLRTMLTPKKRSSSTADGPRKVRVRPFFFKLPR